MTIYMSHSISDTTGKHDDGSIKSNDSILDHSSSERVWYTVGLQYLTEITRLLPAIGLVPQKCSHADPLHVTQRPGLWGIWKNRQIRQVEYYSFIGWIDVM